MGLGAKMEVTDWPEREKWLSGRVQPIELIVISAQKKAASSDLVSGLYLFGSPTRARTRDPLINSQLLYQLSYRGIEDAHSKVIELLRQTECDFFCIILMINFEAVKVTNLLCLKAIIFGS